MSQEMIAIVIFVLAMIVIISEKLHRAAVAVAGAVLLIITKVLTVEKCIEYVDFNTIGVLVGMMLFVAVVKNSGVFEYTAVKSAKLAKGNPWKIMVAFIIITAVLSAFLDNVTTVLLIGPMTFAITEKLELNPIPFIMTQILASNIGGTATLIGDPPNIMIAGPAGLSFVDFIVNNGLIIVLVLIATIVCFKFIYGKKLQVKQENMELVMAMDENAMIKDKALLVKSVVVMILVTVAFMLHGVLHMETSTIALSAATVMMVIGRQNIEHIIDDVEWPTIIFFVGLFIVVGGLVETGVIGQLADILVEVTIGKPMVSIIVILWASAIFSATLDNIPFVATMIPLISTMGESGIDVTPLWWALSLGACLGGNGTLIGASANVVLCGISGRRGYPITYIDFLKIGFPMMVLSIAMCTVYFLIKY